LDVPVWFFRFGAFSLDFIELGNNACLIIMIAEMPDTMMVIASISSGSMARSQHCICSMAARRVPGPFAKLRAGYHSAPEPRERRAGTVGNLAALAPVLAAPATPAVDPTRLNERYRWRCLLCQLFGKRYAPDKDRMKAAQDFAYSHRAMIHAAFDAGRFKADVLAELAGLYEKPEK
jgi:hypothetical protein